MNNFNKIFHAIKELADEDGIVQGNNTFKQISDLSEIPLNKIRDYLDTLRSAGIIKPITNEHSVVLTENGKQKDKLFF